MATTKTAVAKAPKAVKAPKAAKEKKAKEGPGKIEQIIAHHKAGLDNAAIVAKGFNKTTVSIQVSKFKKAKAEKKAAK